MCVCICTCMYECMCVCIYVYYAYIHECVYISKASRFYVLLFRAKKELGFLVALQFSFVITGREREKVPHKARPIYLPLFFQRQQLELIYDRFSCLTGTVK